MSSWSSSFIFWENESQKKGVVLRISDDYLVKESLRPRYINAPRVDESVLCIGDAQVPFHDAALINNLKEVAFAWGVKHCLWVGDMLDLASLSTFISAGDRDLEQELIQDQQALEEIASGFERVTWCAGNHEERASRALGAFVGISRLANLLGLSSVSTTNYFFILIGDSWIATHPKNTSRIAARVSSQLADKFNRNVISFHGHLTGVSQSLDGRHIGIDAGIVADPLRLEYNVVRQGTYPAMTQGAVMLVKDEEGEYHPRIYNRMTDWKTEVQMGEIWLNEGKSRFQQLTSFLSGNRTQKPLSR